jgi:hypothetical protein
MKRTSTWFLRLVIVILGIIALALCIFALPAIIAGVPREYPISMNLLYLFASGLGLATIPFFVALFQSLKLLHYIDNNTALSGLSVRALKIIKYCAVVMSILFATGIPVLFQIAQVDDAPGLGLVALAFAGAPLVIATFAAVLQKVLDSAINIKAENDLTV